MVIPLPTKTYGTPSVWRIITTPARGVFCGAGDPPAGMVIRDMHGRFVRLTPAGETALLCWQEIPGPTPNWSSGNWEWRFLQQHILNCCKISLKWQLSFRSGQSWAMP